MGHYIKAVIHDNRLPGGTPKMEYTEGASLRISKNTRLISVLNWIDSVYRNIGYIDELHILAHGIEVGATGGHGVLFGADDINSGNVHRWSAVAGCVDWIKLYACKIADGVNGMQLCSDLAGYSQAWLTASKARQIGMTNVFKVVEMGAWEGNVCCWDPWGTESEEVYL